MDEKMHATMLEATRLTREGRLNEATHLIQRTLGLGHTLTPASTEVVDKPELTTERFRFTSEPITAPDVHVGEPNEADDVRPSVAEEPVDVATTARRATIRRPAVRHPLPRMPMPGMSFSGMPLPGMPGGTSRRAGFATGTGGGPVDRGDLCRRGRYSRLQTLSPQPVSRAGYAADRDAPRLYTKP